MLKSFQQNLSKLFDESQISIAQNFCKCGAQIKCPQCSTKNKLKNIFDRVDESKRNKSLKTECSHTLPTRCQACKAKLQISTIILQSLKVSNNKDQQNFQISKKYDIQNEEQDQVADIVLKMQKPFNQTDYEETQQSIDLSQINIDIYL